MLNKGITRLQKGSDGTAQFVPVTKREELVKLAGQLGEFNLTEHFGIEERVFPARQGQSAGLRRRAGSTSGCAHSLVCYRTTRSGKKVTTA